MFSQRDNDQEYFDFAESIIERKSLRSIVENDVDIQTRVELLNQAFSAWWHSYSGRVADLPSKRNLSALRTELLDTFVADLLPLAILDRFKLAGVVASWWTDTLPDFKTLVENGFAGVIEGWLDAIADAVEDDETAGPAFDPFGHKLVRRTMPDYLDRMSQLAPILLVSKARKNCSNRATLQKTQTKRS